MKKKSLYTCFLTLFLGAILAVSACFCGASATENSWATMASMPTAMAHLRAAVVDGKIYAIGGANEVYDPATNTWETKTPMTSGRTSFGIAVCDNKIYVIGGYGESTGDGKLPSDMVEVYDPATDTWETKASMPTARAQLTATAADGKIYAFGGFMDNRGTTSDLNEVYDPQTNTWSTKKPMVAAMYSASSVAIGSKIYVLWGQDGGGGYLSGPWNQIYDTETNSWMLGAAAPLPVHRSGVVVTSGQWAPQRIYVVGGEVGFMNATDATQVYDPQTDTWSAGASLPTARQGLALAVVDDLIYALGGSYPDYNSWSTTASSPNRHYTLVSDAQAEPVNFIPQQVCALNERYTPIGYLELEPELTVSPSPSASITDSQANAFPFMPALGVCAVSAAVLVAVLVYFKMYRPRIQQTEA